ncbi:MAG: bifunctional 2-polyprenyl-6-hydroxyphenol methylase/3-demethylubiquinol 3-O-methyltransferase UbiG [Albidovulum sp.]|nr:bifunctional 2-polyprenyl-6-hydroxyphenol methylase/3-demethylubiquinol 3-O-methyltransferase UbiG [Albidovulum sp.]
MPAAETADSGEIAKFEAMAEEWWDPNGKFKPLHELNPVRLDYIRSQLEIDFDRDSNAYRPFQGLRIADIGCGGGLVSEPMTRLGASVVGIDAAATNIQIARRHAKQMSLDIDYRNDSVENLLNESQKFDAVLSLEVIEHVSDPLAFLKICGDLLKPGGAMICSTLNRTTKCFALAIVGAEYALGWLPKGSHDWNRFLKPDELYAFMRQAGLDPIDRKGFVFDLFRWSWRVSETDLQVNYITTSRKLAEAVQS